MKKCTQCGEEKPEINFRIRKDKRQGSDYRCLDSKCKECQSENKKIYHKANYHRIKNDRNRRRRENRAQNPNKYKAISKKRYSLNRDNILKQQKQYYQRNKSTICEKQKIYNKKNPEVKKKASRKWARMNYELNPEKCRESSRKYRKNNLGKCREANKKWREANREARILYSKRYNEINKDKIKQLNKKRYIEKYADIIADHIIRERERRRSLANSYVKKLLREQGWPEAAIQNQNFIALKKLILNKKRSLKNNQNEKEISETKKSK